MTYQSATIDDDINTLPKLPAWVTSGRAETFEAVAFRSGAALTMLDAMVSDQRHTVPVKLLANKLALKAATATSKLEGRIAKETDIRDAYHLTRPGEARGPDGDLLTLWRQAVRVRLTDKNWCENLKSLAEPNFRDDFSNWIEQGARCAKLRGPLAGCVTVMRAVLEADDRAERLACLLSDVVLAHDMNWASMLPITAQYLTKAMLQDLVADQQNSEQRISQHILKSIESTIRGAHDLSSKAAILRSFAPKLRAKGSDAAVALFLSEDAVAPSTMLSPMIKGTNIPMTGRAARRFCDRLVELGMAHELTGRSTFRLYGIAP